MQTDNKVERYAFWLAFIIVLVLVVSSCNVHKTLRQAESKTDATAEVNTAITQTITETIDTCIAIAGQTLSGTKAIDQLQAGDSIFEETPELEIITKVEHGRIKTTAIKRAVIIPVQAHKSIVTHFDQAATTHTHAENKVKDVDKKVTGGFNLNWLWLILAGVVAVLLWRLGVFNGRKNGAA